MFLREHFTREPPLAVAVVAVNRRDWTTTQTGCFLDLVAQKRDAGMKSAMGTDGDDWCRLMPSLRGSVGGGESLEVLRDAGSGSRVVHRIATGRNGFVQKEGNPAIDGPESVADVRHRFRGDNDRVDVCVTTQRVEAAGCVRGQGTLERFDLQDAGVGKSCCGQGAACGSAVPV